MKKLTQSLRKLDIQKLRNKKVMIVIAVVLLLIIVSTVIIMSSNSGEEVTYRETEVVQGDLVVGISESGSVDVGTVEQIFELDMSALQRAETDSGQSGSASGGGGMGGGDMFGVSTGGRSSGGLDMFSQIFGMAGSSGASASGTIGNLTVAEVCVSVGQQVQEGDILYLLEEESVTELQEELQSNVEKAEADLNAVYADQTLSKQTAQYTYDSSVAYGSYASTEYDTTIASLENAVTEAEKELETAKSLLSSYREQLELTEADYAAACEVLEGCEWSRDNTDKWTGTYDYVTYFQMAQTAQSNVDSLEQKKEQLEKNVEQAEQNVTACSRQLNSAKRNLESGSLTAQETLSLRQLAYDTAQETYDIALEYLEDSAAEQEETYADAEKKWEEFSSHIDGNAVTAKYNGVITEVSLKEGDAIQTNDVLVTLYDMDEVSMTVSVDEDDMSDIAVGTMANVSFTAYPDDIFEAAVTEISDAETDGNGSVTYEVTITLQGDVSGLYQGMTGEITFITKESKEVLYVSNRAIIREGTASYVKRKDENGEIRKQEVTTGFSDGVNVEIVEGLSEGDVVLIESKVSEA